MTRLRRACVAATGGQPRHFGATNERDESTRRPVGRRHTGRPAAPLRTESALASGRRGGESRNRPPLLSRTTAVRTDDHVCALAIAGGSARAPMAGRRARTSSRAGVRGPELAMSLQRAKDECAAGARNDRRSSRMGEVRASFRSDASSSGRRLGCAHADPYRALGEDSWIVRRRAATARQRRDPATRVRGHQGQGPRVAGRGGRGRHPKGVMIAHRLRA
jgi:hypothetical protein